MGMQQWAIEQSHRRWHRQAGTLAMVKGESRRVQPAEGTAHARLLIEGRGKIHRG